MKKALLSKHGIHCDINNYGFPQQVRGKVKDWLPSLYVGSYGDLNHKTPIYLKRERELMNIKPDSASFGCILLTQLKQGFFFSF